MADLDRLTCWFQVDSGSHPSTGSRDRLEDERHANGASAPIASMQAVLAADAVVDLPFQMLVQVWLRQWVRGKGDMVCI